MSEYFVEAWKAGRVQPSYNWGTCEVSNMAVRLRGLDGIDEFYILSTDSQAGQNGLLYLHTHIGRAWGERFRDYVAALREDNNLRLRFGPDTEPMRANVSDMEMHGASLVKGEFFEFDKKLNELAWPRRALLTIRLPDTAWVLIRGIS